MVAPTLDAGDLIDGDTAGDAITSAMLSTGANILSNVGNYAITGSFLSDMGYQFNITDGTLGITKAMLTATASDASREYGLANPALSVSYSGFRNGENSSVIDTLATATTGATIFSNVGSYATTASGATDNNYAFTYADGTLGITKATVQVVADNKSRYYGSSNPALSVSYSGFRNGENSSVLDTQATATTAAMVSSSNGVYAITPSGAVDNNYAFNYTNGTLTVLPRVITVSVNSPTVTVGNTPEYKITYSGFVPGDNQSVLTSLASASDNSPFGYIVPGNYIVSLAGASAPGYDFVYKEGALRLVPVIPETVVYINNTTDMMMVDNILNDGQQGYNRDFIHILEDGQNVSNAIQAVLPETLLFISPPIAKFYFSSLQDRSSQYVLKPEVGDIKF